MDEKEIIEQAKLENEEAFITLVQTYKPFVEKLAFQFGIKPTSIADVTQETFIKIHQSLHQFTRGKFSTWVYQITLNVVRDDYRRNQRQRKLYTKAIDEEKLLMQYRVYFEDDHHERLHEAVKLLDVKYRLPIILFYFHNQSYEEIAIILKLKQSTVKTRMHRGKGKLKEMYQKLERKEGGSNGRQRFG